ncbi:hypothetical protein OKW21_001145 [Catalinimonas alkaloidigena]|uniref:hypothetical protein n=1 Tax=Catalinimonas alkaloidigena TaxID=1075417 RepID=UPI0024056D10|nr:hypothetical protein [Catalinimonas alkaloidigena]MDF9795882.1 hypothetical protein [Catalinimonas alkaloidigena]
MDSSKKMTVWRVLIVCAVLLTIITFSPLVIPQGVIKPELFGMPYTLWISILVTILYVVLTFIGTRVHPGKDTDK